MCQRWPSKATSSRMWVCLHVWLVRGNKKDKLIKTSSHDSHVLKTLLLWPAWIWVAFGRGLTWVWPGLGQGQAWARIPLLHSHIFVTAGGGGGCVIWGLARYTALVTVLVSRQGFLFGSQLKRTTVRQRTEGCVWASVCVRLRKSLEKWAVKKVKALSKGRKSHNAEAIRSRQQSTLSHSCCVTAVVNNLT